jgi:hypothetical protein
MCRLISFSLNIYIRQHCIYFFLTIAERKQIHDYNEYTILVVFMYYSLVVVLNKNLIDWKYSFFFMSFNPDIGF